MLNDQNITRQNRNTKKYILQNKRTKNYLNIQQKQIPYDCNFNPKNTLSMHGAALATNLHTVLVS